MKSLKDLVECNYKKEEEKFYSHEIEIENKTRKFHLFINVFQIVCNIIVLFLLGVLIDNLQKGTYLEWIFILMIIIIMLPFCVWFSGNVLINTIKNIKENKMEDDKMDEETVELTNEEIEYLKIVKEKYQEENICNLVKKLETIIEEKENDNDFKNMTCENYNCGLNQKIQNLRQQLSKMGEEINIKNKKLAELKKELTICKDTLRRKTQSNRDLQHRVHKVNTEFAIKELQHIEDLLFSKAMQITGTSVDSVRLYTINEIISGEIEKLKGE